MPVKIKWMQLLILVYAVAVDLLLIPKFLIYFESPLTVLGPGRLFVFYGITFLVLQGLLRLIVSSGILSWMCKYYPSNRVIWFIDCHSDKKKILTFSEIDCFRFFFGYSVFCLMLPFVHLLSLIVVEAMRLPVFAKTPNAPRSK